MRCLADDDDDVDSWRWGLGSGQFLALGVVGKARCRNVEAGTVMACLGKEAVRGRVRMRGK